MTSSSLPQDTPTLAFVLFEQIAGINSLIVSLNDKVVSFGTRLSAIEQRQEYLHEKLTSLQLIYAHLCDTCEVRVSGIPREWTNDQASLDDAARKVLYAMECFEAAKYVYKTRKVYFSNQDRDNWV